MTTSPLQSSVDGFLRYLKVERQLSPLTLLNYGRQLTAIGFRTRANFHSYVL